jgi:hypothetical protein
MFFTSFVEVDVTRALHAELFADTAKLNRDVGADCAGVVLLARDGGAGSR